MASPRSTRSSKNEVLTTKTRSSHNIATASHLTRHSNNNRPSPQTANSRKKRDRDALDAIKEEGPIKKVRYAVEIESRPIALFPQPKALPVVAESKPEGLPQRKATPPPRRTSTKNTKTQPAEPPQPTIHHQKVANGIKHELDRLQPSEADTKDEKRKLRSQEGTRFKSELSRYFPDYDEVIGNDPKEEHFLNHDTPIIILDNAKTSAKQNNPSPASSQRKLNDFPIKTYPDSLFNKLNEAHRVDFSFLDTHCKDKEGENPLPDSYYQTVHRKPERNEKLVRNTDKGKAQHEKDQVIRLLEGLQGHDWLKVLGVSGITESRKKEFEPARDHFIKGCFAIIEKFKTWREEEKRRRIEKERSVAAAEVEEQDDGYISDGDPPDYSDVDASAARQLHEEAIARSAPISSTGLPNPKVELIPEATKVVEKDFKSFFSKPYLREAALRKLRRSGRTVQAWGQPVPDVQEAEFVLGGMTPEELWGKEKMQDIMKAHERRKRRDRRVSKD